MRMKRIRRIARPSAWSAGAGREGRPGARQGGFALLEVLIAIVISVIGILGMIGLQARTYQAEAESYQRSQALILIEDIAARLSSNRAQAAAYVQDGIGAGDREDCSAAVTTVQRDLCEVGNNLRGAAETDAAGIAVGAMSRARACITTPTADSYVIAVVWAGIVPTGAPASDCEAGNYGDDGLRRAVTSVIVIADLDG
jgi:type IV pilus assembly protein PilV